ncbi:MAG: hypothetical protein F6K58_10460 [Symploca sp. SIO2E9]|nr:hypothetical protein [Symploca sp. SIO2E9]
MASASFNWTKVVLSSVGVLTITGAYAAFVIKQLIAKKDQEINILIRENEKLNKKIEEKAHSAEECLRIVTKFANEDNQFLRPEFADGFKKIARYFSKYAELEPELRDYKHAARWLDIRKQDWIKEASNVGIRKYPKLIPRKKRRQFKKDIENYLQWVHICLSRYGHPDVPFDDYVDCPAITFPDPYIAAIDYIKYKEDWGELTKEQSESLKDMLDELTEKIRN